MYKKRVYGQSKNPECIFCGDSAVALNSQKLPCCEDHRNNTLEEIFCVCKGLLELKHGKYGPFFVCPNCGIINLKKGLSMRDPIRHKQNSSLGKLTPSKNANNTKPKETIITSDEVDFL